ncbi:uncharacterized protein [Diadema setosum]|uniref:uncharacterized protein n=1 Tax=Diadema setosum TaxID=31175 RepID=UPI003B3A2D1C
MAIRRTETNLHDISVMDIQASDSDSMSNEGSPDELETGNNLAPAGCKENEQNSSCPSGGLNSDQPRKKTRRCTQQSLDRDIEFFENAREQDENTLFFHSMAKLTSRLPLLVQLKLRLDIHKLVNDAFTEEMFSRIKYNDTSMAVELAEAMLTDEQREKAPQMGYCEREERYTFNATLGATQWESPADGVTETGGTHCTP